MPNRWREQAIGLPMGGGASFGNPGGMGNMPGIGARAGSAPHTGFQRAPNYTMGGGGGGGGFAGGGSGGGGGGGGGLGGIGGRIWGWITENPELVSALAGTALSAYGAHQRGRADDRALGLQEDAFAHRRDLDEWERERQERLDTGRQDANRRILERRRQHGIDV